MSEDQDLLAKISQLAGKRCHRVRLLPPSKMSPTGHINLHKTQQPSGQAELPSSQFNSRGNIRGSTSWRQPRGAPYSRARGRGGRLAAPAHRNRTLVLNGNINATASSTEPQSELSDQAGHGVGIHKANENEPPQTAGTWVAKRDRHMQLINTSIYDKDTQSRVRAIQETRKLKAQQRDEREKLKIHRHLQRVATQSAQVAGSSPGSESTTISHKVTVNGIQFRVTSGGSKLVRDSGRQRSLPQSTQLSVDGCFLGGESGPHATPKKANIGGVTFLRSKNGNLYRSGLVKAKQ